MEGLAGLTNELKFHLANDKASSVCFGKLMVGKR